MHEKARDRISNDASIEISLSKSRVPVITVQKKGYEFWTFTKYVASKKVLGLIGINSETGELDQYLHLSNETYFEVPEDWKLEEIKVDDIARKVEFCPKKTYEYSIPFETLETYTFDRFKRNSNSTLFSCISTCIKGFKRSCMNVDTTNTHDNMSKENAADDTVLFPRGQPRIVLFIDDLDRCEPNKVIDVLEALQLLVKTNLFVVVVAIDPRYVCRSLELRKYVDILNRSTTPTGMDFLEKIIQIPYRVPMASPDVMTGFIKDQVGPLETGMRNQGSQSAPRPKKPSFRIPFFRIPFLRKNEVMWKQENTNFYMKIKQPILC